MSEREDKYREGYEYAEDVYEADQCLEDLEESGDSLQLGIHPDFIRGINQFIKVMKDMKDIEEELK